MYPIMYKGKEWYEEDCDDVFLSFYSCPQALGWDQSVYVAEGERIYPDGEWV
nr:MAG TPA: hypothetical protein [Caudoviricetes sp.]